MDDIEARARQLYEIDTLKPATVYPWEILVALAVMDPVSKAMVEKYRKMARSQTPEVFKR